MKGMTEKQFSGLGWATFWFNCLFCRSTEQTLPTGSQCMKACAIIWSLDEEMCSNSLGCLYRCFLNRSCVKNQNATHQQQIITLVSGGGGLSKERRRLSCEIRQVAPNMLQIAKYRRGRTDRRGHHYFLCDVSLYCLNFFIRHLPLSHPDQGVTSSVQNSSYLSGNF